MTQLSVYDNNGSGVEWSVDVEDGMGRGMGMGMGRREGRGGRRNPWRGRKPPVQSNPILIGRYAEARGAASHFPHLGSNHVDSDG